MVIDNPYFEEFSRYSQTRKSDPLTDACVNKFYHQLDEIKRYLVNKDIDKIKAKHAEHLGEIAKSISVHQAEYDEYLRLSGPKKTIRSVQLEKELKGAIELKGKLENGALDEQLCEAMALKSAYEEGLAGEFLQKNILPKLDQLAELSKANREIMHGGISHINTVMIKKMKGEGLKNPLTVAFDEGKQDTGGFVELYQNNHQQCKICESYCRNLAADAIKNGEIYSNGIKVNTGQHLKAFDRAVEETLRLEKLRAEFAKEVRESTTYKALPKDKAANFLAEKMLQTYCFSKNMSKDNPLSQQAIQSQAFKALPRKGDIAYGCNPGKAQFSVYDYGYPEKIEELIKMQRALNAPQKTPETPSPDKVTSILTPPMLAALQLTAKPFSR